MRNDKTLGAQGATEDASAGSIASDTAIARHTPTPGPWKAHVDLFRPPKLFVHAPDSFAVCRVMTAHYHAEVARANAHLIAAAPEMKEALLGMKPLCDAINALIQDDEDLRARFMAQLIAHGFRDDAAYSVGLALAKAEGR